MAPSSGHHLIPKVLRVVKFAIDKTSSILRAKLPQSSTSLQPVRIYAQSQSAHHPIYLKQSSSPRHSDRWFTTSSRSFTTLTTETRSGVKYDRSKFPSSKASRAISERGSAPFASTLRPNLTGGALPHSAGGYSLGGVGKARHFSHIPGAQAQIIHNVSTGIRAFFVSGGKARFDGVDPITGEKRFRSVSATEDAIYMQWESPMSSSNKGTSLDFKLNPTITALYPSLSSDKPSIRTTSLNNIDLLSTLTSDFARAIQDLSLILADLRALSTFGDLPIAFTHKPTGPILSVRFPGCDADLVSRLCDEVGVRRGVVIEDEGWHTAQAGKTGQAEKDVEMALLFPFAPNSTSSLPSDGGEYYFTRTTAPQRRRRQPEQLDWRNMISPPQQSRCAAESWRDSHSADEELTLKSPDLHPHSSPISGYESLRESDFGSEDPYVPTSSSSSPVHKGVAAARAESGEYEGVEGIYKFLQVCEEARR